MIHHDVGQSVGRTGNTPVANLTPEFALMEFLKCVTNREVTGKNSGSAASALIKALD